VTPGAKRIAILISELMVFLITTAFTAYFIAHAGALHFVPGDAPPAEFPVIAYDGDRAKPVPGNYRVMPWSEWEGYASGRPGASLLLPERAATLPIGDTEAAFEAKDEADSRQAVELTWRTAGGEQHARYLAQARAIEPRYLRTLGSQTFLMSIVVGFIAGLFTGRVLRRRWLTQPGSFVPPLPKEP
jgi:hypothetical protein